MEIKNWKWIDDDDDDEDGDKHDLVNHTISKCRKLAQKETKLS